MNVVEKENFLTEEEIKTFLDLYDKIDNEWGWDEDDQDFWNGRTFELGKILEKTGDREIYGFIINIVKRMQEFIMEQFNLDKPIYTDLFKIVKWNEGSLQPPHSDNSLPDGSPNYTPWRLFSAVIYINDEYSGGQTYFENFNYEVHPKAGKIAIFYADAEHNHGVREVKDGERKTIITFWCYELINKSWRLG